jgi:tetratricopeptide (TPR) repeat protein
LFLVPPLEPDAAVQLFIERAVLTAPALELGESAMVAIRDICARLDGLPLAIELAASRTRVLDVTEIARRLTDRFTLLTGGPRTALPRHQTLRAVVDWSYDALTASERLVFERLSVFGDGATLEAAEQVCSGDGVAAAEVADLLDHLVDKSLVQVSRRGGPPRFTMLQTLVDYGRERLNARGQGADADARLAQWASTLAAGVEQAAYGEQHGERLKIVVAELANLQRALAWCEVNDRVQGLEIASRLGWAWYQAGRMDIVWQTLKGAGADDLPDDLTVRARTWGGYLAECLGEHDAAEQWSRSAVELSRRLGNEPELGLALFVRGSVLLAQGHADEAEVALDEARECFVTAGSAWWIAMIQLVQSLGAMQRGDLALAEERIGRSLAAARPLEEDWILASALQFEGELAERTGDTERVVRAASEAMARGIGSAARHQQAFLLAVLARMRALQGQHDTAVALAESALEVARRQADGQVIGAALYARGVAHVLAGRSSEAEVDLRDAIAACASQHNGFGEAICRIARGELLANSGRQDKAIEDHRVAVSLLVGGPDRMLRAAALGALAKSLAGAGAVEVAGLTLGVADREHPIEKGTWVWDRATRIDAEQQATAGPEKGEFIAARMRGASLDAAELLELVTP